jgi:hypothetical protein
VASTSVSTHRRDEYLQAARIALQPDGVLIELDLTPGIAVAESIIATIDHDADGSLSRDEQTTYAGQVVSALEIKLDAGPLPLRLVSSTFPSVSAFRRGEGTIRLQASATHPSVPTGPHQLFFRNAHFASQSAYLANALVPESSRVSVTGQRRDVDQRELTIDYAVRAEAADVRAGWLLVSLTFAVVLMVRVTRWSRNILTFCGALLHHRA